MESIHENEPIVEVYKKLLAKRQASMKMSGIVEVYKKLLDKHGGFWMPQPFKQTKLQRTEIYTLLTTKKVL